jgi:hypothetical protein
MPTAAPLACRQITAHTAAIFNPWPTSLLVLLVLRAFPVLLAFRLAPSFPLLSSIHLARPSTTQCPLQRPGQQPLDATTATSTPAHPA